jgi:hypothetical protein
MHFVLDHNFPFQATAIPWPPAIQVTRLVAFDPKLIKNHDDWQVMLALYARGSVDAFVTNDKNILDSAREMVALSRTNLALIVTEGVGEDAFRATGLIMTYLPHVTIHMASQSSFRPVIYRLHPVQIHPVKVDSQVSTLAQREHITWKELVVREGAIIDAN